MKIDDVRDRLIGRLSELTNPRDILKASELKELFASIKEAPADQRASLGAQINALRGELEAKVQELEASAEQAAIKPLDVTAP